MIEPWLDDWWELIEKSERNLSFDIGANDGEWTKQLSTLFDKVVSFEPDPRCVAPEGTIYDRRPVWNESKSNVFYQRTSPLQSSMTSSHPVGDAGKNVDVINELDVVSITLDDIVDEYGPPGFIKMDIEGAEAQALEGATKDCFSKCHWLVEIHDTFTPVIQHFQRLGFTECKVIDHPNPLAAKGHKWIYVQPQE